jgi:hypothetical protein
MAIEYGLPVREDVPPARPVKARNPWAVFGLGLITFGIYNIVLYYKVNREMRDFGRARGDFELATSQPGNSVLAVTLGGLLIVPPFVSMHRTAKRIARVQDMAGSTKRINVGIVWLLIIGGMLILVPALFLYFYLQSQLNSAWTASLTPLGPPPATAPGVALT